MHVLFLIALLLIMAQPAAANGDITFISSLGYADKEINFNQRYSGDAANEAEFNVHLPMVVAGLTVAKGKWFASLKAEKNLSPTSTTTQETDRSRVFEPNLLTHPGGTIDVAREDYSFSVGYNVYKRLNIFAGYISGETQLTPDPFCANPFASDSEGQQGAHPDERACSRSNRAFLQFYLGDLPQLLDTPPDYYVEGQAEYQQTYKEQGLFAGASYGFAVRDLGILALSFAYASLDGEYSDNANDPNNGFAGSFTTLNFKGSTNGTSIAATWTGSLSARTAYNIDIRRQAYSLDARDQTGRLSGVLLNTDETMIGVTAGLQVYF